MRAFQLLDLFSGIGGFSLGLERSGGFRAMAFCEINSPCRRVLAKHWPEVPCYDDVRTLTADKLLGDGIEVDAICGGFPCQDLSVARSLSGAAGDGMQGARSGLWREYARLISEIRPRYVIVENVPALLVRGLGDVLGDLAKIGYDAEWHCIPASRLGLGQRRDRAWIIAAPVGVLEQPLLDQNAFHASGHRTWLDVTYERATHPYYQTRRARTVSVLGNADRSEIPDRERSGSDGRLSDGLDRYRALGNAVVPQIPEMIGRAIMESLK